ATRPPRHDGRRPRPRVPRRATRTAFGPVLRRVRPDRHVHDVLPRGVHRPRRLRDARRAVVPGSPRDPARRVLRDDLFLHGRRDRFANEAALKYFLLGAFSSALLVYGFAWLYGVTGSTRYLDVATELQRIGLANGPTVVALALVTVGLGFKAAVVPFHQWTPDAYA